MLSPFGEDVLAAAATIMIIAVLAVFPGIALGQATSTLVGQNLEISKTTSSTPNGTHLCGSLRRLHALRVGWCLQFRRLVDRSFRQNGGCQREGHAYSTACFCFFGIAFALIISKVLSARARRPPMISALIARLLIQIPLAIEWSESEGAAGAYSAMVVAFWVHGLSTCSMLIRLRKKLSHSR